MIYGWGTDHVTKQVDESTVAVCRFRYVSLAFIFSFVWKREWFLQGRDRTMDREVSAEEIESMFGAGAAPSPGLWKRFGVLFTGGALLAYFALGATVQGVFGGTDDSVAAEVLAVAQPADADLASKVTDNESAADGTEPDAGAPTSLADQEGTSEAGANDGVEDAPSVDPGSDGGQASSPAAAVARQIELVGDSNFMSSDMENPGDPDYVELTIDRVHATSSAITDTYFGPTQLQTGDVDPEDGNKLVVVDLQMLGGSDSGNVGHDAIRVVDERTGALFAPAFQFNMVTRAGTLFNERLAFEVPAELVSFTIQGGALDGQRDGYQTNYKVELEPGDITAYQPTDGPIIEGPASVSLTSDNNVGSPNLEENNRGRWAATFDVLKAEVVAKIGPTAPNVGYKYLVLDAQVVGTETRGNVGHPSIRLLADGEWYQAPTQFNEVLNDGTIWSDQLVYEIPVAATSATVEFGTPNHWTGGQRAEYQLTLPTG